MMTALWVSKTGLSAQDTQLATISNNLANVATVGFKRDRVTFEDLLYQIRRCSGPCTGEIDFPGYTELVHEATDFLSGRSRVVAA